MATPATDLPERTTSLTAIVVTFRTPGLVSDCLRSLAVGSVRPKEVIVVDAAAGGPGAQDTEALTAAGPIPARIVPAPGNPGYSAACNLGAAAATGERLLFLNADVRLEPDCLERVLAEVEADPGITVATASLRLPDGSLDHACHRGIPTPLVSLAYKLRLHRLFPRSRRLGHYTLSWLDPAETHDIEACSGAFLLIGRAGFDTVGGWDERYRFYAEDLDLCLRVARVGGRIRYVADARATHLKGASSHLFRDPAALDDEELATRSRTSADIVEAHELFYREHLEAATPAILRPFVTLQFALQRRRGRPA